MSPSFRSQHPEIPGHRIVAQRNVPALEYGESSQIAEMDEGNSADIDLVVYGFIEFEMDGRLVGGADWLDAP